MITTTSNKMFQEEILQMIVYFQKKQIGMKMEQEFIHITMILFPRFMPNRFPIILDDNKQ